LQRVGAPDEHPDTQANKGPASVAKQSGAAGEQAVAQAPQVAAADKSVLQPVPESAQSA
jgi:hypothetical protein